MNTLALIRRDDGKRSASFTEHAYELRAGALATAGLIGDVWDVESNAAAVAADQALQAALKMVEEARIECKRPVLQYGQRIDDAAKEFVADLKHEQIRIRTLLGNFAQVELAKQRAAQAARERELRELDRKRQEELAAAETHAQRDEINSKHDEEARFVAPPIEPVRAKGQVIKEEWEIVRINEMELARSWPQLIRRIEFDMPALKALLAAKDGKVSGVEARKVVHSTVRAPRAAIVEIPASCS